ncbi:hypothetical protein ACIBEJ_24465 [Nonomuraea sp. NPDC050790]|uniref:hypothetical protein n=1 Tax=Nonomuraea sp. NPDC050790 TaxID=3364371 RepID=UPI0037A16C25
MERARQLVGDMLIYCFVVVLVTGGYLAWFHVPSDAAVVYDGSYAPLRGTPMSESYASALEISFEVRGGLLSRQLHHTSAVLLGVGTVIWVALGHLRYVPALLGLGLVLLTGLAGYGSVDDVLSGTVFGSVPTPLWYGLHLVAALAMAATLVVSAVREGARRPRTPGFVALGVVLTAVVFLWR